jgi:protein tyrosine phosphatase (PTP) superfamily phosphohydrolase (DUF442 family)
VGPQPPPPPPANDVRPYEPSGAEQGSYYWRPAQESAVPNPVPGENGVRYLPPAENGGRYLPPAENGVRLGTPIPDHGIVPEKPNVREEREMPAVPEKPEVREEREQSQALPVGIPQFAQAKDRVASGLKPSIDGLDWLKDNGYKTVLHIRAPGEDDAADRQQITKRGMKYLSLEVSPQTLSAAVVQEFSRVVGDAKSLPLFVYDKDGMLAGGLWYLYFRTVDNETDETAATKAARLGLQDDRQGEQKAMWLAIQKFLSDRK